MAIFDIGEKILFLLIFIFFLALFLVCRSWAKPMHPERRTIIGALISILYTFWFLVGGFLFLMIISFIYQLIWK